jgi:hypothetical protein
VGRDNRGRENKGDLLFLSRPRPTLACSWNGHLNESIGFESQLLFAFLLIPCVLSFFILDNPLVSSRWAWLSLGIGLFRASKRRALLVPLPLNTPRCQLTTTIVDLAWDHRGLYENLDHDRSVSCSLSQVKLFALKKALKMLLRPVVFH